MPRVLSAASSPGMARSIPGMRGPSMARRGAALVPMRAGFRFDLGSILKPKDAKTSEAITEPSEPITFTSAELAAAAPAAEAPDMSTLEATPAADVPPPAFGSTSEYNPSNLADRCATV